MSKLLLRIFSIGIAFGIIIALLFTHNPLYTYARWRSGIVMGKGVFLLVLNNIAVVFLALFGGVLFSLMEIGSYNTFPRKLYDFMDKLSYPLHFLFSLFDPKINKLRNPMKSCYFLSVAFPIMIIFINVLLFSNLLVFGVVRYGLGVSSVIRLIPLVVMEFFCIVVASLRGYSFPKENFSLYRGNDTAGFRAIARKFLRQKENWIILFVLSSVLLVAGFIEVQMIM